MHIRLSTLAAICLMTAGPALAQPPGKSRAPKGEVQTVSDVRMNSPVRRDDPAMFGGGFTPDVAATLLQKVCKPATDKTDNIEKLVAAWDLKPVETPQAIRWALPEGAKVWSADTVDSRLYVYAYGVGLSQCGAVIARPLPGAIADRLQGAMSRDALGFQVDSDQEMAGGVRFVRMKSAASRYADMLEYPPSGNAPGLLKIELLP